MLIENNESFLSELSKLFANNHAKGSSLYITMKRYDGRTKPHPTTHHEKGYKPVKRSRTTSESSRRDSTTGDGHQENKCLIRAQLNDKKISTIVTAKEMNRFQVAYSNLLKGNLHGLKKKDKDRKSRTTKDGKSSSPSKATQ